MSRIKRISDLPHETLEPDTWIVSETSQRLKAIQISEIVDYVAKEAKKQVDQYIKENLGAKR